MKSSLFPPKLRFGAKTTLLQRKNQRRAEVTICLTEDDADRFEKISAQDPHTGERVARFIVPFSETGEPSSFVRLTQIGRETIGAPTYEPTEAARAILEASFPEEEIQQQVRELKAQSSARHLPPERLRSMAETVLFTYRIVDRLEKGLDNAPMPIFTSQEEVDRIFELLEEADLDDDVKASLLSALETEARRQQFTVPDRS